MRVYKRTVFRMRPKLQIGCSIDGKKGKLCIGKVYFFFSKKIVVIYQILFLIPLNKKLSGHLHTITISKIFKLFNYSKFSTLEVSKFTRVCKVGNVQLTHFIFLHIPRIYRSKWYIASKFLIIAAEVSCSSNAVFVLSIFRKYFLLRVFL